MNQPQSNIPENEGQWDTLWLTLQEENELTTDRERYQFLTQMVMGITGAMSEMGDADPNYEPFQTFVHLVFDEWQVYDTKLSIYND